MGCLFGWVFCYVVGCVLKCVRLILWCRWVVCLCGCWMVFLFIWLDCWLLLCWLLLVCVRRLDLMVWLCFIIFLLMWLNCVFSVCLSVWLDV